MVDASFISSRVGKTDRSIREMEQALFRLLTRTADRLPGCAWEHRLPEKALCGLGSANFPVATTLASQGPDHAILTEFSLRLGR